MRKFVVLTEERCGYQYLAELLKSHPDIVFLGEVFAMHQYVREESLFQTGYRTIQQHETPDDYIDDTICVLGASKKAFGFKLQYDHAEEGSEFHSIWDKIVRENWSIIHLQRENLLDRLISLELAVAEDKWFDEPYETEIYLYPERFEHHVQRSLAFREKYNKLFAGNPMFMMKYEEFIADPNILVELQGFLGVDPKSLTSTKKKQMNRQQKDCVTNYKQLYEMFGTHDVYGKYFTSKIIVPTFL